VVVSYSNCTPIFYGWFVFTKFVMFFLSFEEKNLQATHAAMHNMENASLVELKDMSH